ncbi:MAG: endonuclease MutS2 [Lachnospiraceae bacterium]|nr:endonuclease MutS2 [Lachnospiraceae bacterium]
MNAKGLKILEFHKVIEQLTAFASSDPGKEKCRHLLPETDLPTIEQAQLETADALSRLFRKNPPSFSGNSDLTFLVKSLEIGSILSSGELLKIASLLECTGRIRSYGKTEKDEEIEDSLTGYFRLLEPLTHLLNEIRRCILEEDVFADDASPNLKKIRKSMQSVGSRVHTQLTGMLNGSIRTYLQDPVITMRDNRYCIPVKAEYKNHVPGMIHDQSSSGSTLFIEPAAVVNLNNELRELELKEKDEIEKILADLSVTAAGYTTVLQQNFEVLSNLDFIFAKAFLAYEENATRPLFSDDRSVNIRKGRHPLLDKKKVVPIDLILGEEFDLLIVTGPNTGGKTVSLKTMGLLCAMAQAGLHIPALDRSKVALFTEIYADIGDEQSIEQSLSTFSSHMTNIVSILEHADENSLCLFDELGAGTDPTEGAALAISILDHLHGRGIRTMATTHYSELKVYALSTPFVENACCEFDVETLRPTYRLLIGIPGKSNAFAISKKLGLSDEIIEHAKKQIDTDKTSFEDLLADLEASRITIEAEREETARYKEEIEALKMSLAAKQEKLDASRDKIIKDANEQAREILQDAKSVADETIRTITKAGPGASMKDLEKARGRIRDKISEKNSKLALKAEPRKAGSLKPEQLKKGDGVRVLSMGLKGIVQSLPDKKGNLFVQCGIIRSQVHISDLAILDEADISAPNLQRTSSGKIRMSKSASVSTEINLLGKTVDEAIAALDKYLDDAYLAHLSGVRIVHGKGTGALRSAVHSFLKRNKNIKEYRLGAFGEGDAGVTIATFK